MATTIWKGRIAFGLVSFPVQLQAAARSQSVSRVLSVSLRGIAAEFKFSREWCSCYFLHGVRQLAQSVYWGENQPHRRK